VALIGPYSQTNNIRKGHCLDGCHASPACPSDKSGVKMDICMGHYWIATGAKQDRQFTYKVTMRRVRVTIVAVEKYIPSVCVCVCRLKHPVSKAHAPLQLCCIFPHFLTFFHIFSHFFTFSHNRTIFNIYIYIYMEHKM